MRTREEIKEEAIKNFRTAGPNYSHGMAQLEVLLDIRELLSQEKESQDCSKECEAHKTHY